ncbi:MAG: glycosyltransferase family 39 protein [Deltaproteobacteria bacterium]|nr:glycosyltransferase family 39 protein [Deltaproteobacteria bacterium]
MQERSIKTVVLILLPLMLYLIPLPFIPLMEPDEGRYSAISSAMNATGDYVTPRLKAAVYFEKPPLVYWATALFFRIFGENEFSSRLFAALCAWGCILLVYRMGLFFHDARTGLYAAAVLTTFLYHVVIGRTNILDMPLAFFVSAAIWSGFRFFASAEIKKRRLYLLYLFSALAFLAKGLIGIVFPFGILTIWLLISGRRREVLSLFSAAGILIFTAVSLPWLILIQRENPDFFRFFFIQEHLLRYATRMHGHNEPFYFYLPILLAGALPWFAFLPEAIRGLRKGEKLFSSAEMRFLATWFVLIFLFFSISSSKLIPYIAPVFLPIALGFGHFFRRYEERIFDTGGGGCVPLRYRLTGIVQSILFMAGLFVPLFLRKHRVSWDSWWPWIVAPFLIQILILFLPDRIRRKTGRGWFATVYLLFALFLASTTLPAVQFLAPYKSAYPLSQAIMKNVPADATLYQYGMSLYGVDFYTGKRTPIVDDIGEVWYGSQRLPAAERNRYFLTTDSFLSLVRETDGIYCATKNGDKLERLRKKVPALRVLWHNDAYTLVLLMRSGEQGS